ncbi:N-acetylglucosamine-specific PTS transporter subunit IIBC [Sorangium sp. So ce854]|uniref:N-acetylglucosamine-specific PTS transporter subunit IIBC n=1 Tax=Sorangium sp. So ce854 TaxID=3133322 RepID=UPI003F637783
MRAINELQRVGKALMLPIAVLPVAGLLLRLGQPDVLDIAFVAQAGGAIFDNLALIFAVGIAVGLAHERNGVAGLSGMIAYLVITGGVKTIDDKIKMGVLAGILAGVLAGAMYNRFRDTKLPAFLGFFGGSRFVPIVTGGASLALALVLGLVWPPVQAGIDALGGWIVASGPIGAFFFGVFNRLLIPTGLHHILNNLAWFVVGSFEGAKGVVTGDLNRYFAGDPSAGTFMAGFYPVMMFGLPAACLAIYRTARPENRKATFGVMFSAALTAFLTGITEPIEFAFMFLAPALYAVHAVLTGVSLALLDVLGVKHGFSFSAGFIDYALNHGLSTRGWVILPVGLAYAVVYYGLFVVCIERFNLATPGREAAAAAPSSGEAPRPEVEADAGGLAGQLLRALGGHGNLREIDACITRLRLVMVDRDLVKDADLKALGAKGVVRPGTDGLQVILGPMAESIAREMRELRVDAPAASAAAPAASAAAPAASAAAPAASAATPAASGVRRAASAPREGASAALSARVERWLAALGGAANVVSVEGFPSGRVRVELADDAPVDDAALEAASVRGVMRLPHRVVHLLVGPEAPRYAAALAQKLKG